MSAIFISHCSKDVAWAQRIKEWLKEQGYRSLLPGFNPEAGVGAGASGGQPSTRGGALAVR